VHRVLHRGIREAGHQCERFWRNRLDCPFGRDDDGFDIPDDLDESRPRRPGPGRPPGKPPLLAQDVMMAGVLERQKPEAMIKEVVKAIAVSGDGDMSVGENVGGVSSEDIKAETTADPSMEPAVALLNLLTGATRAQPRVSESQGSSSRDVQKLQQSQSSASSSFLAQAIESQLSEALGQEVKTLSEGSEIGRIQRFSGEEAQSGLFQLAGPAVSAAAVLAAMEALRTRSRGGRRPPALKDVSRPSNVSSIYDRGKGSARGGFTRTGTGTSSFGGVGGFFKNTSGLGVRPNVVRRNVDGMGEPFEVLFQGEL